MHSNKLDCRPSPCKKEEPGLSYNEDSGHKELSAEILLTCFVKLLLTGEKLVCYSYGVGGGGSPEKLNYGRVFWVGAPAGCIFLREGSLGDLTV